jgi:signal transduction histidine kinase
MALEAVPDAAVALDHAGRVLGANGRLLALLGTSSQDLAGERFAAFVASPSEQALSDALDEATHASAPVRAEVVLIHRALRIRAELSIGTGGDREAARILTLRARMPLATLVSAAARSISNAIANGENAAALVRGFLGVAVTVTPCAAAQYWENEAGELRLWQQEGSNDWFRTASAVEPLLESLARRAANSRVTDCLAATVAPTMPSDRAERCPFVAVALPINALGMPVGVLVLALRGGEALDAEGFGVLETVAEQLGQGLFCARAVAEQKRQCQHERHLRALAEASATSARTSADSNARVLAVVSHDARNLLSNLVLNLELLNRSSKVTAGSPEQAALHRASRSVTQMRSMVEDLQQLSAIDLGAADVDLARHDAAELIDESVQTQVLLATSRKLTLTSRPPVEPCFVRADRPRILQVLNNLLGNAIKFTPPGGLVTVAVARHGDEACFSVRDDGVGIAAEHLDKVFERHWQASRKSYGGVGLGLSIARSLVESHGGRIWVHSDVGRGTTVFFSLALAN